MASKLKKKKKEERKEKNLFSCLGNKWGSVCWKMIVRVFVLSYPNTNLMKMPLSSKMISVTTHPNLNNFCSFHFLPSKAINSKCLQIGFRMYGIRKC
jgi:hypothetical protein